MKKIIRPIPGFVLFAVLFNPWTWVYGQGADRKISFYEVPLVCGADTSIGCGSRIKPLFLESSMHEEIAESWTNKRGTVIGFVWAKKKANKSLAKKLFKQFEIDASLITNDKQLSKLHANMNVDGIWFEGMAVDSLSLHEAGTIAASILRLASETGLLQDSEMPGIKSDMEAYFKIELVKVRTPDELKSAETQDKWQQDAFDILVSYVGEERGKKIADYVNENRVEEECKGSKRKSCCDREEVE